MVIIIRGNERDRGDEGVKKKVCVCGGERGGGGGGHPEIGVIYDDRKIILSFFLSFFCVQQNDV